MPIEMNSRIVRVEGLQTAVIDDEIVILNLQTNNYVALDEVGRRIWDLLESPWRVADLCRQLSQEFEASPEQIMADVLPFLGELTGENLAYEVAA